MNILFVNEKCGYFGGVEQNISETAKGLREKGHRCFLAWGEEARTPREYARLFDQDFHSSDFHQDSNGTPLNQICADHHINHIYFHKIAKLPNLEKLHDCHLVRMIHDHDLCCPRKHKYFVYNKKICRKPFGLRCWFDLAFLEKNPNSPLKVGFSSLTPKYKEMKRNQALNALLVGSQFMREELIMNGFAPEKVHILPPVVQQSKSSAGPVPTDPIILFVGQLIYGKGVDLLLAALSQLKIPFQANIVGDGNARASLEALSDQKGLKNKVTFHGWIPRNEIDAFYNQARVLAVPSRWAEPFGMIGLEAMNHGRPVVGFDAGGIGDWLENNVTGILVPENDTTSFAHALEKILSDDELAKKMAQQAIKKVSKQYDFQLYLNKLEELLDHS